MPRFIRPRRRGATRPLRYRGYVYDPETGLYYLQSRYYAPSLGRFLNADAFVSTGQGQLGNNMFAYCLNNPIVRRDATGAIGEFSQLVLYSFIHMCVQIDIAEKYGYAISVYVNNNGVKGYLDLYDPESNSYYEVKSKGVYESGGYAKQLKKYNGSVILALVFGRK